MKTNIKRSHYKTELHGLQIEYNVDEGKDYARNIIINGNKISHNRKNRHIHYYRWMEGSKPMYTQVTYKQGTLDIEEIENTEQLGKKDNEQESVTIPATLFKYTMEILGKEKYLLPCHLKRLIIDKDPNIKFTNNQLVYARTRVLHELGIPLTVNELLEKGSYYLLGYSESKDILVFGDVMGIKSLSETSVIQCDGIFKMLLSGYTQLYSFHANEEGVLVPCLLCLTKDRTSTTYIRLLNVIDTIGREFDVEIFGTKDEEVMRVMINRTLKRVVRPSVKNPTWSYEEVQESTMKDETHTDECVVGELNTGFLNEQRREVTVVSDFESGFYQP